MLAQITYSIAQIRLRYVTRTMTAALDQISARLDRLPVSRFHFRILAIAAASLIFDTLDGIVITFVLADLKETWHFDVATIGYIAALGLAGYLVGAVSCGLVADRIGRKKTILATLVLYSLFSAARGFANDVPTLAALHFITFIFIGAESSTVPPYLAEFWPARVRGKLNGVVMGFFGVGIALSPVWALMIIPHWGWRWALFLTAPFALIGGIMRTTLPESPRWLIRVGRAQDADTVVTKIEAQVERQTKRPLPAPTFRGKLANDAARTVLRPRDLLTRHYRRITIMLWAAWFA